MPVITQALIWQDVKKEEQKIAMPEVQETHYRVLIIRTDLSIMKILIAFFAPGGHFEISGK